MSKQSVKELKDMFELSSGDGEDSDYNTRAENSEELSVESFDTLAEDLCENVLPGGDEKEGEKIEDKDKKSEDIISTDVEDEKDEKDDDTVTANETEEDYLNKDQIKNGKIIWIFNSPSEVFEPFYKKKKELMSFVIQGAELDFDALHKELSSITVGITDVYDTHVLADEMTEVQRQRERIREIQLKIIRQYYLMKKIVLHLHGVLARIRYLKPQIKQNGLISEHMGDVEIYDAELDGIYEAAKKVEGHMQAAFDTMSRKAFICHEVKEVGKKANKNVDSYDTLPEGAAVGRKGRSESFLDWDEIPS